MSKQVNKIQVVGPIVIGVMIAVSMGASIYTAVQTSAIKTKLNALQSQVVEVENNGKSLYASVEGHFAQLVKSGGGGVGANGDVKSAVQAALAGLEEDKLAEKRAELYKGWEQVSVNKDGRYIYGNPDARFTLVNYEDLECPFCKQFHKTPKYLVDTANNGAVNWEWRHFNLAFHEPMATKAAMTAECVAEQKGPKGFWGATNYWFEHTQGNGKGFEDSAGIPALFELDKAAFDTCMQDPKIIQRIKRDMDAGTKDGVNGTPTTIVLDNKTGERESIVGARPFAGFVEVIERMVKGSSDTPSATAPAKK
ncbi:DsbA family protein [Providencia rettgeri]|uniref:DsbA family protein n=1 Tax=Providencia rettgeri TaxID=587 RepID=UPI00118435EE|nr:thioredoxin domain-containing protein [Providencia rettgeri]